jgi:hypothetical protein
MPSLVNAYICQYDNSLGAVTVFSMYGIVVFLGILQHDCLKKIWKYAWAFT